jgi:hypothetical protein
LLDALQAGEGEIAVALQAVLQAEQANQKLVQLQALVAKMAAEMLAFQASMGQVVPAVPPLAPVKLQLAYPVSIIQLVIAKPMEPLQPMPVVRTGTGSPVLDFSVEPPLPASILLDRSTGILSGTPGAAAKMQVYRIHVCLQSGGTTSGNDTVFKLNLEVMSAAKSGSMSFRQDCDATASASSPPATSKPSDLLKQLHTCISKHAESAAGAWSDAPFALKLCDGDDSHQNQLYHVKTDKPVIRLCTMAAPSSKGQLSKDERKAAQQKVVDETGNKFKHEFAHEAVTLVHTTTHGRVWLQLRLPWLQLVAKAITTAAATGDSGSASDDRAANREQAMRKERAWMRTGEALICHVNPVLDVLTKRQMQKFARDIEQQGMRAELSDMQFVKYMQDNHSGSRGPNWVNFIKCTDPTDQDKVCIDELREHGGHKCGDKSGVPCYFHSQPIWVRIASLFVPYNPRGLLSADTSRWPWDTTALCNCIAFCSVFSESEQQQAQQIRDKIRNEWGHQDLDMDYEHAYDLMEGALRVLCGEDSEALKLLREHRAQVQHSFPARDSLDGFKKAAATAKFLTRKQYEGMRILRPMRGEECRRLVDSPSGSGKTFVAVRLADEFVQQAQRLGLDSSSSVLLCSHSRRLQKKTVEEVLEYAQQVGHEMTVKVHGTGAAEVECFTSIVSVATGVTLVVATIDALLTRLHLQDQNGSSSSSSLDGAFAAVIIDEGQHVFSRQPHPELEGQHVVPAARVREELERCTKPREQSWLYVFHDPNQCYTEAAVYPEGIGKPLRPFPQIIRNPGRVRDAAISYCGSLERESEEQGRIVIHELHENAVVGPAVRVEEVERSIFWQEQRGGGAYAEALTSGDYASYRQSEQASSIRSYAQKLAPLLDELFTRELSLAEEVGGQVAVLMPGSDRTFVESLRVATASLARHDVVTKGLASGVRDERIVWCAVENFSGCECAYVIVTGFQNPEYLIHRRSKVHNGEARADPSAYLAATRCTYQLIFVEPDGKQFAKRFLIADAKDNIAEQSDGKLKVALLDGETIQTELAVDLAKPPARKQLQAAVTVVMKGGFSAERWRRSGIEWQDCPRLESLSLVAYLKGESKLLNTMRVYDIATLQTLDLQNNQLQAVPEAIGSLTALQTLRLENNQLIRLPATTAELVALQQLGLDHNPLVELPPSTDRLASSRSLQVIQLDTTQKRFSQWKRFPSSLLSVILHVPKCGLCRKEGAGFKQCAKCKQAHYCCRDHQVEHWAIHKRVCKAHAAAQTKQGVGGGARAGQTKKPGKKK